jgi:hypothetical protein
MLASYRPPAGASLIALAALLLAGCVTLPTFQGRVAYRYFVAPAPTDPWSPKIAGWQARERAQPDTEQLRAPASVSGSGLETAPTPPIPDLREKYFSWRAERKRRLARETAAWIQREAKAHYVPDGPIDHWATLEETLKTNGDDCDGLELLVYHFLRDLGFEADEVFRAIVYRPSDGQHHMVTLWFEDEGDPWVIDPTGAMTGGMPRMSQVGEWVPLKVFSEDEEFTVEARGSLRPPL